MDTANKKSNKKQTELSDKIMPENIFKDIDPRDPIVVIDDIISHLQEMQDMLISERETKLNRKNKKTLNHKITLSSRHPLLTLARRYCEQAQNFLNEFWFEQQKNLMQYGLDIPIDDVAGEIERLTWFYPVILSKAWRYATEKITPEKIIRRANTVNLPPAREVLIDCVGKSEKALMSFNKKRAEQKERTEELLKLLGQIKQNI
jgi:hypothetical protein